MRRALVRLPLALALTLSAWPVLAHNHPASAIDLPDTPLQPRIVVRPIALYEAPSSFSLFPSSRKLASGSSLISPETNVNAVSALATESRQGADYMHARYYGGAAGRFLSPDSVDGMQRSPQSWNRYAYVRNNPLIYTDPTGMYTFGACTGNEKQCQADQNAFERARQQDLTSSDAAVQAAAAAYGDQGVANGIAVAFGNPSAGGTTTPMLLANEDGTIGMTASVVIQSGARGTELNAIVGHEGQHLADAQGFIASFGTDKTRVSDLTWNLSKNLSVQQTEMNAYRITQSVYASAGQRYSAGCQGCELGRGKTQADVNLAITRILTSPKGPYAGKLTGRQFPEWTTAPESKP